MTGDWPAWVRNLSVRAESAQEDRHRGALLGLMVGDALGASWEFSSPLDIWVETFDMRAGGPFGFAAGETTDDTAMTLAALLAYNSSGQFCKEEALRRYISWMESGPKDIGMQTKKALTRHSMDASAGLLPDDDAQGNGTAMRAAAHGIGATSLNDAVRYAAEDADLTHPSAAARAASAYVAGAVFSLREGMSASDTHQLVKTHAEVTCPELTWEPYTSARHDPGGWCLHSVKLAAWALLNAESFEEGVSAVIRSGGDSDTNAAIAGSMLGARFGASAIPRRWVDALQIPRLD